MKDFLLPYFKVIGNHTDFVLLLERDGISLYQIQG